MGRGVVWVWGGGGGGKVIELFKRRRRVDRSSGGDWVCLALWRGWMDMVVG